LTEVAPLSSELNFVDEAVGQISRRVAMYMMGVLMTNDECGLNSEEYNVERLALRRRQTIGDQVRHDRRCAESLADCPQEVDEWNRDADERIPSTRKCDCVRYV
jgi:hypothetical protein